MSLKTTPLHSIRLGGCCGQCGKTVPSSNQHRRCKRCALIVYCSRKCEREHWKCHKKVCKPPSAGSPDSGKKPSNPVCPSGAMGSVELYRPMVGQEPDPDQINFACWCCAKLLLKKIYEDSEEEGYVYCDTLGRRMGGPRNDTFIAGESYPSALESASMVGVSPDEKSATACLPCAHALQVDPQKHLHLCEEWLSTGKHRIPLLPDINMVTRRCMAMVILEMNPDFSLGPSSIGGYIKPDDNGSQFHPIAYNDPDFEFLAFPYFFPNKSATFQESTGTELLNYTAMRLGSTDNAFRRYPDYVTFSYFRLVAYGCWYEESLWQYAPAAVKLGAPLKYVHAIPLPRCDPCADKDCYCHNSNNEKPKVETSSSRLYRPIVGQEPDPEQVAFACWCCAKLLLKKSEQETEDRYTFCNTFGRRMGGPKNNKFVKGQSYPSALAAATLVGVSTDKKSATACLDCASALHMDPQMHLRECEEWLRSAGTSRGSLPEHTSVRTTRGHSRVILEMNPDFTLGPESIGGYLNLDDDPEKLTPITFNDPTFEIQAFPFLFPEFPEGQEIAFEGHPKDRLKWITALRMIFYFAKGGGTFEGSTKGELRAYTAMRLCSTDKAFRQYPDYVAFSCFRMVAYGAWSEEEMLKWFPTAVELGTVPDKVVAFDLPL